MQQSGIRPPADFVSRVSQLVLASGLANCQLSKTQACRGSKIPACRGLIAIFPLASISALLEGGQRSGLSGGVSESSPPL